MSRRALALGLGLAVALGVGSRVALVANERDRPLHDPDRYLVLAESVARGDGLRVEGRLTAYRPPLYPLLLVPGFWHSGLSIRAYVLGLNLVLGAWTIGATAVATRRWGGARPAMILAATLVALDPVLVSQAPAVMTETLAAALVAAMLAALSAAPRPLGLASAGLAAGLATLSRPSLLPAAALVAAALAIALPGPWRGRARSALIFTLACSATLAPWAVRNAIVLGRPVITTTHGGYTFALANNAAYYDDVVDGPPGAVWSGPNQERWFAEINRVGAGLPEPAADTVFYREGWRTIRERPGDFARATLGRLTRFWAVAPSSRVYPAWLRWLTAAWTVPFWFLVGIAVARRRTWAWPMLAALAVPVALTAVHAFYWTDLRMRAPAVPALALVAASAFDGWSRRVVVDRRC